MADHSKIEWTDATWNPVTGCSVVSPGCTNCYAMKLAGTRLQHHWSRIGLTQATKAGPVWTGEVRFNEEWLTQPLQWKKPRRIFVCAHGDLFHESVPDEWIDRVFAVMALAPQHTFQVLTKRSARMREYLARRDMRVTSDPIVQAGFAMWRTAIQGDVLIPKVWPLPNVWLGVSAEDQTRADERIPDLLATPAAVRFISAEPLLGPVDLTYLDLESGTAIIDAMAGRHGVMVPLGGTNAKIDWVIAGGESGPTARPMHPDWARFLRDQCAAAGVAFHFKQWGEWVEIDGPKTRAGPVSRLLRGPNVAYVMKDGEVIGRDHRAYAWKSAYGDYLMARVGKAKAGRKLDGRTHDEFPA